MTEFLIKSTLCSGILLAVYLFLLEREKIPVFNRFFLLFSLVFSLALPFITIEIAAESVQNLDTFVPIQTAQTQLTTTLPRASVASIDYFLVVLLSVYTVGTALFLFRFGKNLRLIRRKIQSNLKVPFRNAELVLIPDDVLPHTFLNYIFINRDNYENRTIEAELYTHELTHVTQKHSLDILFIELLRALFWFNPLLLVYKKAIQLNHEFLADQSVVASGSDIRQYQNLLLEKSAAMSTFSLASNLNFPITKKRFLMMTKTTSPSNALLKTLALIPVFSAIIFYGCTQTVAQQKETTPIGKQQSQTDSKADYYKETVFEITSEDGTVTKKKFAELTENQVKLLPGRVQTIKKAPTQQQLNDWKKNPKYAIWIDGKKIQKSELDTYKASHFVHFNGTFIHKNARSKTRPQDHLFTLYTAKGFDKIFNNLTYPKVILWQMDENPPPPPPKYSRQLTIVPDKNVADKRQAEVVEPNETPSQPEFPGGMAELQNYVISNIKIIPDSKPETIIAAFVVQSDGKLINVDIKKATSPEMAAKVKAVLEASPKWIPGKLDGKPVNVQLHLPIKIQPKK